MTSSNLFYLQEPEMIPKLIELGQITYEEVADAQTLYDAFREKLDAEWTPTRTKELLLNLERDRCQFALSKIKAIELENADARKKGVSFKERQKYSTSIDVLRKMFEEHKQKGLVYKRGTYKASQFVTPLDVAVIEEKGFEHHMKFLTI